MRPRPQLLGGQTYLGLLLLYAAAFATGQGESEAPTPLVFDPRTARASLFDGRSLGQWQKTDFYGQGEVSLKDQAIHLERGHDMTGITWTGPLLRMNYEIRLEAKRVTGTDFFCGLTFPVGEQYCSFICGGWGGSLVGISNVDYYDAANNQTSQSHDFTNGQWYTLHVRVTEKLVQAWIDGDLMVDLDTDHHRFSVRHEVAKSRPLGIATWQTAGALRNISIRKCDPVDRYLPSFSYFPKKLEGWSLQVSEILEVEHPQVLTETLSQLEKQLNEIHARLPAAAQAKLQEVPIWIEYEDRDLPEVCYHEDPEWLRARGYNPDKIRSIEIAKATGFLQESANRSTLLLNPLARAYHQRVLGLDHPSIKKAYAAALAKGIYEDVPHASGSKRRHVALDDERSYFAEGTEAFFGRNDYYPFSRAELELFDPELHHLVAELWEGNEP